MNFMAHVSIKDDAGDIIDDEFLFGNDKLKLAKAVESFIEEEVDGETKELVGVFSIKLEDGEDELPDDTEDVGDENV